MSVKTAPRDIEAQKIERLDVQLDIFGNARELTPGRPGHHTSRAGFRTRTFSANERPVTPLVCADGDQLALDFGDVPQTGPRRGARKMRCSMNGIRHV